MDKFLKIVGIVVIAWIALSLIGWVIGAVFSGLFWIALIAGGIWAVAAIANKSKQQPGRLPPLSCSTRATAGPPTSSGARRRVHRALISPQPAASARCRSGRRSRSWSCTPPQITDGVVDLQVVAGSGDRQRSPRWRSGACRRPRSARADRAPRGR